MSCDEASNNSKLLLPENEPSLSFDGCLEPTVSKIVAYIPLTLGNLFLATTGCASSFVSKPVEVSLTDFPSVAFEGADGTDVGVLFLRWDLALG